MYHRLEDIMKLSCELSADKQIQTTVKGSAKGAAAAGSLAFAGGLVGGPLGIAVGGAIGGLLGCWLTSGEFKPLPQVIMELSSHQQQKLYEDLVAILGDIQWTDVAQLTTLVLSNSTLKQQLTAALLGFVTKELQAKVHYVD
ncbi:protein C19orf12 homolog [Syngnathus typhle]|uniref:protein C19orf12 homolog n=1 Tax=Syngnathus typhle TaxID=161592 RepID=UPI002A6B7FDA|nr:protein C19orf12 homolog [Syngnathus typhle]XP_061139085.1 protein C19orf12 homolog [Syngnathus typhle]XP_061139086.1 protein C19orf12 homolog [Syngnathus typhle]